MLILQCFKL